MLYKVNLETPKVSAPLFSEILNNESVAKLYFCRHCRLVHTDARMHKKQVYSAHKPTPSLV